MRRLFTTAEALRTGLTRASLHWAVTTGRLTRVIHGVYGDGPEVPTELDRQLAAIVRAGSAARGRLAPSSMVSTG